MKIFLKKNKLIKCIQNEKDLGFVPTMGAIHEGHISLFKRSIQECKKTIVTIFVNKPQFNKKADYKNYPRNTINDIKKIRQTKVDYLYLPTAKQIYPNGKNRKVKIIPFSKKLCGKYRPGHFEAVVDVIDRFTNLIRPKKIYLGNKDMQQLIILENFIKKKFKKIKVVGCKTIREKNGLAISSRNLLLTKKQKKIASLVYRLILKNKKKLIKKFSIAVEIKNKINKLGITNLEYLRKININKINNSSKSKKNYKIFVAYYLGKTRLIDNI